VPQWASHVKGTGLVAHPILRLMKCLFMIRTLFGLPPHGAKDCLEYAMLSLHPGVGMRKVSIQLAKFELSPETALNQVSKTSPKEDIFFSSSPLVSLSRFLCL